MTGRRRRRHQRTTPPQARRPTTVTLSPSRRSPPFAAATRVGARGRKPPIACATTHGSDRWTPYEVRPVWLTRHLHQCRHSRRPQYPSTRSAPAAATEPAVAKTIPTQPRRPRRRFRRWQRGDRLRTWWGVLPGASGWTRTTGGTHPAHRRDHRRGRQSPQVRQPSPERLRECGDPRVRRCPRSPRGAERGGDPLVVRRRRDVERPLEQVRVDTSARCTGTPSRGSPVPAS